MDIFPVIMAGGVGTRFWPLSRKKTPKQFLPIISEKTMIEETVERLLPRIPVSNIFTIANDEQSRVVKDLVPGLPAENCLVEPRGKNTAPSLILATATIFLSNPEAVVAALPADHLIKDSSLFLIKLEAAAQAAWQGDDLVTFGIPPTSPATGYGYIQFSPENPVSISGEDFFRVQAFIEKPDLTRAKAFVKAGNYAWNSGMFIWQASVFAQKLEKYAPDMFVYWEKILDALQNDDREKIASIFDEIPSISIDYALMEKAQGVLTCKGNFGWSDVGAWSALTDIWKKDDKGNALRSECLVLDAKNCLVYNPGKLTALVGVQDIIVVETPDALLVCAKDSDQKVKEIVELIHNRNKIKPS